MLHTADQMVGAGHSRLNGDNAETVPTHSRSTVHRAQRFVTLKEDAKHESLREVALLRAWMIALDSRFGFAGTIFFLTLPEIGALSSQTVSGLFRTACDRHTRYEAFKAMPQPPSTLTRRQIERGPLASFAGFGNPAWTLSNT